MGWKTRIARKKAIASIKLALTVFGIMDLNGAIELLKVLPESKTMVFYNRNVVVEASPELVPDGLAVVSRESGSTMGSGEENAPQVKIEGNSVVFDKKATFTAYNTVEEQTDGSPCIAADGTNICEYKGCVVAQNGVPFGTKIEVEGIGVCEVKDRKASRFDSSWIDVAFGKDIQAALAFGKKELSYRVID